MSIALPGPIVTTEWLMAHYGQPGLVVVDASWYLPAPPRYGRDRVAYRAAAYL